MPVIRFHFDVISPFAYLAFEHLPQALAGCSYTVEYRPILFAGLLKHWGQKGPAEIEPKRAWTFRHLHWWAQRAGIPFDTPAQHPFNPLPLLRLALACAEPSTVQALSGEPVDPGPNRRVVEALFRHVWLGGEDATDPTRLAALRGRLAPMRDPDDEAIKLQLRRHTEQAVERGIFGVPSFELEGHLFWGLDGLEMLRDALQSGSWFEGASWVDAGAPRPGLKRRQ
jgi:2-hydroxychromene-2-carboxylate isomerase